MVRARIHRGSGQSLVSLFLHHGQDQEETMHRRLRTEYHQDPTPGERTSAACKPITPFLAMDMDISQNTPESQACSVMTPSTKTISNYIITSNEDFLSSIEALLALEKEFPSLQVSTKLTKATISLRPKTVTRHKFSRRQRY